MNGLILKGNCHMSIASDNRDLKIYDATARRHAINTQQIFIEDNNYE